ncbi:MAG: hypothetical protein EXR78_09075 [Deltaproteobacteria bacterium]|nr:hypothetical protein [Deltaproteobacteria bacterium]
MTVPPPPARTSPVLRLNLDTGHVRREGEVRVLTPKALAVLSLLIEHPQQVVSKETLLATVWAGTTVSAGALKTCLWELRRALGDHPQTPSFIGTLPRRGYWFIGSIQRTTDAATILLRPVHAAFPASGLERRRRHQVVVPVPAVSPRSVSLRASLFGREVVLTQLRSWFEQAKAGKPQVVFVTGEVGIGKTAVIEAFLQDVGSAFTVRIARGQCVDQHAEREAYFPVLEALGQLGRSAERTHVVSVLRARKLFRETRDRRGAIYCRLGVGELAFLQGKKKTARAAFAKSLEQSQRYGYHAEACHALAGLALVDPTPDWTVVKKAYRACGLYFCPPPPPLNLP